MLGLAGGHGRDRRVEKFRQLGAEHALRRAVHPLDPGRADDDDADQHRVEDRPRAPGHRLAVADQRLELRLLALEPGDVGQHGDRLVAAGGGADAAHREREPARVGRAPAEEAIAAALGFAGGELDLEGGVGEQCVADRGRHRPGIRVPGQQLGQRRPGAGAGRQPQHGLEAAVAAHEHAAAQVGDAGGRALEDGGHLAQQLVAARLAALLVGDVEGDDRGGLLARGEGRRLDPGEEPAAAEIGMLDRVAHLGPLGPLQRLLQTLVLGQRLRGDDVAADVLQQHRGAARGGRPAADPARRLLEGGDADAGRVHHRPDLDLRQVALFLDAAVLDHAHVAAFAAGRAIAADDGAQAPHLAAGLRHPALRLDRPRAGAQALERPALAPGEQRPAGSATPRPATPARCRSSRRTRDWCAPAGRCRRTGPCRPGSGRTSRRSRAPSGRPARAPRARWWCPAAPPGRAARRPRRGRRCARRGTSGAGPRRRSAALRST